MMQPARRIRRKKLIVTPAEARREEIGDEIKKAAAVSALRTTVFLSKRAAAEKAVLKALEGEPVDELLGHLSQTEVELFWNVVTDRRNDKDYNAALWKVDYVKPPPTINTFLDDPYWLGDVTQPKDDNPGIFPGWYEAVTRDFDLDSRIHNLVVTGSLGTGKCHGAGTKVMMHDCSCKVAESVVVGDKLMGDDSKPRVVTSVTTGSGDLFKITPLRPRNSPSWTCNSDHILCLKGEKGDVIELSVRDYLSNRNLYARYKLYRAPLSFTSRRVPLDPWWLGLWLGDGCSNHPSLAIAHKDARYLLPECRRVAKSFGLKLTKSQVKKECNAYSLSRKRGSARENPITRILRSYGIISTGGASLKRIPDDYLYNSVNIRRQLLAGMIDSDGSTDTGGYVIGLANKPLIEQLTFLARSLGYNAAFKYKLVHDQNGTPCDSWVLTITGAYDLPLRLPRKRNKARSPNNRRTIGKTGFTIEPLGPGNYYGFTVDGNYRYLLEDTTVTHNSWISSIIMLYRLAMARLLRNPQNFFGLSKGSYIYYVVLSLTKGAVQETVFGDMQNFMGASPFFIEECHFNPDLKYSNFRINIRNGVYLTAGSKGWHAIGRNVMGVFLDEGNWRLESNPDVTAYKLYDEVRTRIQNRFQKLSGFLPAISILASSARDESSFTERVITDIKRINDPRTQTVYRFAVYNIKRHALKLKPRRFCVAHGLKNVEPCILSGWYNNRDEPLPAVAGDPFSIREAAPPGSLTEYVPEDYLEAFKRNCKTALQSISGISAGGSNRLFASTIDVEYAITEAERVGAVNPSIQGADYVALSDEDNMQAWNYLEHKRFLVMQHSRISPLRHPGAPRFGHLDLATSSVAGLAICHVAGSERVSGVVDTNTGVVFDELRLIVEFDFILAIVSGKSKPINFEKIQKFIFWLREKCGYHFELITADTYQSVGPLQLLQSRGFKTGTLSIDRTKVPYYTLRTGFEERRIRIYRHPVLVRELENLIDGGVKVDHPETGSKDVADAVCGAYVNAVSSKTAALSVRAEGSSPMIVGDQSLMFSDEAQAPLMTIPVDHAVKPERVFDA